MSCKGKGRFYFFLGGGRLFPDVYYWKNQWRIATSACCVIDFYNCWPEGPWAAAYSAACLYVGGISPSPECGRLVYKRHWCHGLQSGVNKPTVPSIYYMYLLLNSKSILHFIGKSIKTAAARAALFTPMCTKSFVSLQRFPRLPSCIWGFYF